MNHNQNTKSLVKLTSDLVKCQTFDNNKDEIQKAYDLIMRFFEKDTEKVFIKSITKNDTQSLLISNIPIRKKQTYDYILHGHVDVVSASDADFTPKISGDRLYGRGALDMKAGVSAITHVFSDVIKKEQSTKIMLMLTSDEEVGGKNGTQYLFEHFLFESNFFISAEGEKDYLLKVNQKGVLQLYLKTETEGGHSGYTWQHDNAIKEIISFFNDLEKLFPHNHTDKKRWYTTINLSKLVGGTSTNSIPNEAEAYIDIRYTETWKSGDDIMKKVHNISQKHKNVHTEILYSTPVMHMNPNDKNINKLNKICSEVLNSKKNYLFNNHGTNDARFAAANGISSVAFGPIGDNYHTKDEWVSIRSIKTFYDILRQFVLDVGSENNK